MARIRSDYVFGTTATEMTASTTTLSSARLANLPVVASPDVAALVIHDGTNFEIVHVTAHTASATTATILRAQEGTTARAWGSGTKWANMPTKADADLFAANGITVQDENANVATGVTQIDFQGAGVTATSGTGEVVVTIGSTGGAAAPLWARKTVNESVTSSTTLQDDDHLSVTLDANSTYRFEAMLMIYGPTGADFKFSFPRLNANWSIYWGPIGPASNIAASDADAAWYAAWNGLDSVRVVGTAELAETLTVHIIGSVTTDATGGPLKLQWAQNVSAAGSVTLYKGSHLMAQKVA